MQSDEFTFTDNKWNNQNSLDIPWLPLHWLLKAPTFSLTPFHVFVNIGNENEANRQVMYIYLL